MKIALVLVLLLLVALLALGYYLFGPLSVAPTPASFHCYELGRGHYVPLDPPDRIFGIGLSYAAHIEETAASFDPSQPPPVFEKDPRSFVRTGAEVPLPTPEELHRTADALEPGLGEELREDFPDLSPLLDYEVEMGFVLLEDVDPAALDDPAFDPPVGFFIANDLSARAIGILGEGRANRYDYWGVSKSFPGFMPVAEKAWVPVDPKPNGIPCVELETIVNDDYRQRQTTDDLIYTPAQMLGFVHDAFPDVALTKGTIVLTGTPGGVAVSTLRWKVRIANLLRLSRFRKLSAKLSEEPSRFLQAGDRVTVRGQGLGKVSVTIVR